LYSMTGYAIKSREFDHYSITVEIKSLNNKFLELKFKLPGYIEYLENRLKKMIKAFVKRGKVEVFLKVTAKKDFEFGYIKEMIGKYYDFAERIEKENNFNLKLSLSDILTLKSLMNPSEEILKIDIPENNIITVFSETLNAFQKSRYIEGEDTKKNLEKYINNIKNIILKIETVFPSVIDRYKKQLKERIEELIDSGIDEARLMMEVGIFANKIDISEEVSRIYGHIGNISSLINSEKSCGREMDFIIQEFNREINTIGSKVPEYIISENVVNFKSYLEKIKEQVRNIE